jgi:predicted transcriptional regulator
VTVYLPKPLGREIPTVRVLHRDLLRAIVEHCQKDGGVTIAELGPLVDRQEGAVRHALSVLRWHGLVAAYSVTATRAPRPPTLSPTLEAVLEWIQHEEHCGRYCASRTIAARFGLSERAAGFHVMRLRQLGLVWPRGVVRPTPEGVRWDRDAPR